MQLRQTKDSGVRIVSRLFVVFFVGWFGFVLFSPGFGIHIHHRSGRTGSMPLIHSYFWNDHETNHPPVESPPQSLPEHVTSTGLASDLGEWDLGLISIGMDSHFSLRGFLGVYLAFGVLVFLCIRLFGIFLFRFLVQLPITANFRGLFSFGQISRYEILIFSVHIMLPEFFYLPPPILS